jgi:predicted phage tail protein
MRRLTQFSLACSALTLTGVAFYFTPHIAAHRMRAAVAAKDSATFSSYVDFPALRENVKASLAAKFDRDAAKHKVPGSLAGVGGALASAFIAPMIDSMITPAGIALMMEGTRPQALRPRNSDAPPTAPGNAEKPEVTTQYESFNRFVVTVKKKGATHEPIGLVFHRDGLISWKLSALRLPL